MLRSVSPGQDSVFKVTSIIFLHDTADNIMDVFTAIILINSVDIPVI